MKILVYRQDASSTTAQLASQCGGCSTRRLRMEARNYLKH
jgi:hypothetical protein